MIDRRGSITVSALIGTGAATLGVAIAGLVGVGGQLRAADAVRTTPVLTQELDLHQEQRSPKWDGHSPLPQQGTSGATIQPVPTSTPQPQKEL